MKKFKIYSANNDAETKIERDNRNLARKVAAEGIVLLKNNGVLPLSQKKAALFGTGARMTVFGGAGSGDTKGRRKITIEEGLYNAGIEVESTSWMDTFDRIYEEAYKKWKDEVNESIKGYHLYNVFQMFDEIYRHPFAFPVGQAIADTDIKRECDTAIYVLARQAGEGGDRRLEKGDYYLSDLEIESLEKLRGCYKNLILVINCGAAIDLSVLEQVEIDAVVFAGQPGEEAGNALADILTGKVVPSGHLTATWAYRYEDYPYADRYAYMAEDEKKAEYEEGELVGYRWFEKKKITPRYPMGYGKSYTTFESKLLNIDIADEKISICVKTKNTGLDFAGRQVLQIYAKPEKENEKRPIKELIGFTKTKNLLPQEEETKTIIVPLKELAHYCKTTDQYEIEGGKYTFLLGENAIEMVDAITIEIPDISYRKDEWVNRKTAENNELKKAEALVGKLDAKEICNVLVGGPVISYGYVRTPGAVGKTTNELLKKYGIPNINMADGPAGLNLIPQSLITKRGVEKSYQHLPEAWSFGFLPKLEKIAIGNPKKDTMVCQFTTAFPSTTNRGQTWNKELLQKVGCAVGKEMKANGITLWLAPAINIQKNPLCGRNFEYVSEDPVLSGYMAAAIIEGAQKLGGIGVTVKHFCCNNQETQREYMTSNVEEETLRNLYLKPFAIAIRESDPWALMTSYNKVNGTYMGNNEKIVREILREEWHYEGVVMTDWNAINLQKGKPYLCAVSGNDLIMPGNKTLGKNLLEAIRSNDLSMEDARTSAARVIQLVMKSDVGKLWKKY